MSRGSRGRGAGPRDYPNIDPRDPVFENDAWRRGWGDYREFVEAQERRRFTGNAWGNFQSQGRAYGDDWGFRPNAPREGFDPRPRYVTPIPTQDGYRSM